MVRIGTSARPARRSGPGRPGFSPERILDAARRRFERSGASRTTMEEIAGDAGCARATLYAHFPSKRALYAALLRQETGRFLERLERAAAAERPPPEKLADVVAATRAVYAERSILRGALEGEEEAALDRIARPAVRRYERRVIELLRSVLDEGAASGALRSVDSEVAAYLMFQLGRVLVLRQVAGRSDFSFERLITGMDDLLGRGLASRRGERKSRASAPSEARRGGR